MPVSFVFVHGDWNQKKKRKAWTWFVHGDWHCDAWRGLGKKSDTIWTISSLKIVEIIGG